MSEQKVSQPPAKRGHLWNDWLIGAAISLNIGAKLVTGYLENTLSKLTIAANTLEANPVQAKIQTNSYFIQFVTSVIMYAGLIVFYAYMRSGKDKSEYNKIAFQFFTCLCFFGFLMDFINDLGPFLAVVLKGM